MSTPIEPFLPSIIAAASGLVGALIGGLTSLVVQVQRLSHEKRLEDAKQKFLEHTAAEQRRTEFRRSIWQIEHDSLVDIKMRVGQLLSRMRSALIKETIPELYPMLDQVQIASSKVSRHVVLAGDICAFVRDAKLMLVAAANDNLEILGSAKYNTMMEFEMT
jgi:hypothetical protein